MEGACGKREREAGLGLGGGAGLGGVRGCHEEAEGAGVRSRHVSSLGGAQRVRKERGCLV